MLEIKNCKKCEKNISDKPKEPFINRGTNQKVLVVGEFPKKESHKFFYNQKNELFKSVERLDKYLKIISLNLSSVSFTEMCKCPVNDRKKLKKVAENCYIHLIKQIEDLKPKIVITIGTTTREVFSEKNHEEIKMGQIKKLKRYYYLPLYHPSPVNPNGHKNNLKIMTDNKAKLVDILK